MYVVRHRTFFFWLTGAIVGASLAAIAAFGLTPSIDFTGGSLVEVRYEQGRPELAAITAQVESLGLGGASVRETGDAGITVRTRPLSPAEHQTLVGALSFGGASPATELRFTSIGPSLGSELATKTLYALAGVTLAIMAYIAWAFRHVSRPVPSWVYGAIAVVVLVHDVVVAAGFYALLGYLTGAQVDALFAVALLAILGYSVNDTIVIFDRVRENLSVNQHRDIEEPFEQTAGRAITETLGRSINTSVTVALALLALIIFGGRETLNFALTLFVGVVAGTYSSILVAAPLLVPLGERFARKADAAKAPVTG